MLENVRGKTLDLMYSNTFFKADLLSTACQQSSKLRFFFKDSFFQVSSVAQKQNFDSFWPGRQK